MQKLFENFRKYVNEERAVSEEEVEELKTIVGELHKASDMHKSQAERIEGIIKNLVEEEIESVLKEKKNCGCGQDPCKTYGKINENNIGEGKIKGADGKECWDGYRYAGTEDGKDKCVPSGKKKVDEEEFYEVDAKDINEEYCPVCREAQQLEEKKKKPCKKAKGKKFVKRVNGKCRSYGESGSNIRPGTAAGHSYCARSAGIKKCANPPCNNTLSRRKWKCHGKRSMKT
jgi:hypothetical protein